MHTNRNVSGCWHSLGDGVQVSSHRRGKFVRVLGADCRWFAICQGAGCVVCRACIQCARHKILYRWRGQRPSVAVLHLLQVMSAQAGICCLPLQLSAGLCRAAAGQ